MATYSYDTLTNKYLDFNAPDADILIDGQQVSTPDMALSWVEVEQTTGPEADVARFCIVNGYVWNPTELNWIGTTIAVGKKLVIKMGYHDKKSSVFDGIITGYSLEYTTNANVNIIVTAMDRSLLMMRTSHSKMWSNMKISDVVSQIAGEYSLSPSVDATTTQRATIEQIGVSDYHFLRSLAEELDYLFYISEKNLYFKKHSFSSEPILELKYGLDLLHFNLHVDVTGQTSKVTVRGYDVKQKKEVVGTSSSVEKIGDGSKTGPTYAGLLSTKKSETYYTQASSTEEANQFAKAILARQSREFVKGNGSCVGVPEIKPGQMIKITGLGFTTPTKFLLTKVTHRLDSDAGYIAYFEVEGNAV
ncbi:contractile injection system protein, VgrG/Pvc8 family [Paenibacillus sp. HB172176]|uniref:phage late control D family protein n=1 Tax=Paenibacillus sp. HB172176 TaxID=2493690 RepID=UPI00143A78E4|nr:contractile injection system protein, VgrG/Pvc8 family [Paenibacillus sp. HB172176]